MEEIKKVYIDCGAWTGDSVLAFKKYFKHFNIYAFECEPRLTKKLEKLSNRHNFNFINKAVWINNGNIELFPGIDDFTQSSSLTSAKKKLIDKKNPVKVKAIDLSEWILDNFKGRDYIICKMNIEGAEYDILEKMIENKSIYYIDKLYVAWHYKKLNNFPEQRHIDLVNKLKTITDIYNWNFIEEENKNPFI